MSESTIFRADDREDTGREYSSDANTDLEELTMSVARRMSVSQVIAKKSLAWARESIEKLPMRLTLGNMGFLAVALAVVMPRPFTYILVYPIFRLVFGTLYPAYASYKAVRTKNVKEYVKWMMYWIVFALFTCAETFTDVFFSFWFPFYYEIKIIIVLWLLSPATKGSSTLYRRFVHPALSRREAEIDDALAQATERGYTAVLHLGTRGVNYATMVLMQTAIKNFPVVVPPTTQSTLPASQSDSAISSLANPRSAPTKEASRVDSPDGSGTRGSSRRRTRSDNSHLDGTPDRDLRSVSPIPRMIVEQSTDDDNTSNEEEFNYPCEKESVPIYEEDFPEFKAPIGKPRKNEKKERLRSSGRKATLRSFDPEFSDETDMM